MLCQRLSRVSRRAANGILIPTPLASAPPPFAIPDKGRGLAVPGTGRLLEPCADLAGSAWVVSIDGAAFENALDGFSHVQPTAAQRRVEGHDAVFAQPDHHVGAFVTHEVVPDQQHAKWRQGIRQGEAFRQPHLPGPPCRACCFFIDRAGGGGQRGQDRLQFFLEPAMKNGIGASDSRSDAHLTARRVEQRQDFARPAPNVFVRLRGGLAFWRPPMPGMRQRLEGTGLVLTPDLQAQGRTEGIRPLDQPLFTSASGSFTMAMPLLRLRATTPVSHQVLFFCQARPEAWSARPIV